MLRKSGSAGESAEWDLPVTRNEAVDKWVGFLSGRNAERTQLWLERSGKGRDEYASLLAHHYAEAVRAERAGRRYRVVLTPLRTAVGVDGARAELAAGAPFTLETQPQPGWDGVVNCRFLEIEANRKLSWAWVVGDIDTVVTFTLTPTASGTHLSLVQSGFKPDQKQNLAGARYGWNMMSGKLVDLLARLP